MPADVLNVKHVDIGEANLYLDGVPVGVFKDASFEGSFETRELNYKGKLVTQLIVTNNASIKGTLHEINPENLRAALSTRTIEVSANITDIVYNSSNRLPIRLVGEQKSYLGFKPPNVIVYDAASGGSSITESSNWAYDNTTGELNRIDGGAINDGDTVYIEGTQNGVTAFTELPIGLTSLIEFNVMLEKLRKSDSRLIQFILHRANTAASISLAMNEDNFQGLPVEFRAVDDSVNHPKTPLGFIRLSDPST